MTLEEHFGNILRQFRTKQELSQEALALEADVNRAYISLLERGKRQPSIKMLFKLSKALGVKPEELVIELSKRYKAP